MPIPTVLYEAARAAPGTRFVDLRSPAEFAADHVPGAVNVPLFSDEQRAVVGTLYKQESPEAALRHGLGVVESRLPWLLERILGRPVAEAEWRELFQRIAGQLRVATDRLEEVAPRPGAVVLYCWRGGMRSRSVSALLCALGHRQAAHMRGGYKGYRAAVARRLAAIDPETPLIVLRGPTGAGKTRILQLVERARPGSVLDLEACARHRSSILGDVGLTPATQKAFESALAARLAELGPPPWFVEGESRKVGDRVVPAPLFAAMENGVHVQVTAALEHRVRILGEDYLAAPDGPAQLASRLPFLENRLGAAWVGRLQEWLAAGDWRAVATVLLERYYDGRYARSDRRRAWTACFDAADPAVVEKLLELRAAVAQPLSKTGG